MKLYNANLSNFASKCRLAIYEKNAKVDIVPIPGGDLQSPEYLKIYPMGKTPALEVDGEIIGESEVINELLEESFPSPPLLPKEPKARARARGISRFHDLYLEPPRSEEHTSELQSPCNLVCRLLLEKKKKNTFNTKD